MKVVEGYYFFKKDTKVNKGFKKQLFATKDSYGFQTMHPWDRTMFVTKGSPVSSEMNQYTVRARSVHAPCTLCACSVHTPCTLSARSVHAP